jgi:hypothetical protein
MVAVAQAVPDEALLAEEMDSAEQQADACLTPVVLLRMHPAYASLDRADRYT